MKITVNKNLSGPSLTLHFTVVGNTEDPELTKPITVNVLPMLRFKFRYIISEKYTLVSDLVLKKMEKAKSSTVKVYIACEKLQNEWICTDDWTEYELASKVSDSLDNNIISCNFEVNITVEESNKPVLMQSLLYEDTESTDFQLRVADGAVAVHKCVVAIQSDMFRKLMNETTEGCINLAGLTRLTVGGLQHLKDYMYMGTLPDECDALEMLLHVADAYMIKNLGDDCATKLLEVMNMAIWQTPHEDIVKLAQCIQSSF